VPSDALQLQREAVLAKFGIGREHHLNAGRVSPALLACMAVLAADGNALEDMVSERLDPFKVSPTPHSH
jgi:hypothetical protein